jgi:hypothetical protein
VSETVNEWRVAHAQQRVAAVLLAEVMMVAAMLVFKKELDAHGFWEASGCALRRQWLLK